MVGGLAQGFSLHRPHPSGGTQDTDFIQGFVEGFVTKIFGEDFGAVRGTATPLCFNLVPKNMSKFKPNEFNTMTDY